MVFLFCATSFGVVLTLGGLRYSSVETEIYLLTTQLLDLQAAAALSIVQLLAITALLVVDRPAARRTPTRPSRAVRRGRRGRRAATGRACSATAAGAGAGRRCRSLALVVGSLQVGDAWSLDNYRALDDGRVDGSALLVPVTDALVTSLRTAVDATWMSLLARRLLIAVVVTRRSHTRAERRLRGLSTASSCCRSASPR